MQISLHSHQQLADTFSNIKFLVWRLFIATYDKPSVNKRGLYSSFEICDNRIFGTIFDVFVYVIIIFLFSDFFFFYKNYRVKVS